MNDRIAELKSQCIVREQRGTNAFDNYMVDRFDTEKFAELIVRECAQICFSESKGHDMAFGEHCGIVIKEHFGVE
jgi:hypothetical protein